MNTENENNKKPLKYTKRKVKKRGPQPPPLVRGKHKTNITGQKRGPYIFEVPEETDLYNKLVKALIELQDEYTKYKKSYRYAHYRKSRTWLRTIKTLANELHAEMRADYNEYTNKNVDDE